MSPVLSLAEASIARTSIIGGKARNLGKLEQHGFRVPAALVVTAEAVPGDVDLDGRLAEIGPGPYAVRSSGVTEDGDVRSLAGRYESMLNVEPDAVADAVAHVRSVAHDRDGAAIAVIIQQMVDAVSAGVAFTADPVDGDRSTAVVTATAGLADGLVGGRVAGEEWEVRGSKASPRRRPQRVLHRRLVLRVVRTARRIADTFGEPQDVEWAWDGHDLWVVQARSITGLPADVSWDAPAPGIYHRSLRFGEWLSESVTPLFESWLLDRMERGVHDYLYRHIGQVAPEPLHVVVNGWYFYSLNWAPAPGVGLRRNLVSVGRKLPRNWRNVAGMFPQTIRFSSYREFEDEFFGDILPRYRSLVRKAEAAVEDMTASELIDTIDDLSEIAGLYFGSITVVAGSAYKFEAQLAQFWNRHLKRLMSASHMVLLQGLDQSQSTLDVPRLETLDWWRPPMAPAPRSLDTEELSRQRLEMHERAEERLRRSRRKQAKFRRLVAEAQRMGPIREEQIGLLGLGWPVMRRAVVRLGEILERSGVLDRTDDVFFLTREELVGLFLDPRAMQDAVALRRADRDRAGSLVPPMTVGPIPLMIRVLFGMTGKIMGAKRSERAIVHGVPASPGRATGPVRIVRDSSQFARFEEGEILVAPLTAPAWTELFDRAAAVVTDVGSALAHASIIAREYGIPAVVGCVDATVRLCDGQVVTVDGSTGNVEPADGG